MNRKKLIIIFVIVLVVSFIGVFLFNTIPVLNGNTSTDNKSNNEDNSSLIPQKPSKKHYGKTESPTIKNEPTIVEEKQNNLASKEIKQKQYVEGKNIEISNLKVTYDGLKYYLSFKITNKSNNKYDLSKYNIYLYNKNKKTLAVVDASILGKMSAKESYLSSIEFETNISSVTELEFVTK